MLRKLGGTVLQRRVASSCLTGFSTSASLQAYTKEQIKWDSATYERVRPTGLNEEGTQVLEALMVDTADRVLEKGIDLSETVVVDIGAGTGKSTRGLIDLAARTQLGKVIGVEPSKAMREEFRQAEGLHGAEVVDGTASAIPLPDACASFVMSAQALHWWATEEAMKEVARVLAPGGTFAFYWNTRSRGLPTGMFDGPFYSRRCFASHEPPSVLLPRTWLEDLEESVVNALYAAAPDVPRQHSGKWVQAFDNDSFLSNFTPLERRHFADTTRENTRAEMADLVASLSCVADRGRDAQETVRKRVLSWLADHPATQGEDLLRLNYRTDFFWAVRRQGVDRC